MFFDSHAHVNFKSFDNAEDVIKKALDNNTWVVNVGSQIATSKKAIELAGQFDAGVYAAVGVHPVHISDQPGYEDKEEYKVEKYKIDDLEAVMDEIGGLLDQDKVVALGEVGLDYFHFPENCDIDKIKQWQKEYLIRFIELAKLKNKPLILHFRDDKNDPEQSYNDMLETVETHCNASLRGVVHCFGSNIEIAKKFVDLGFYIGITGIVTFKNAKELQEVVKEIPLEKLLIETDCPYLTPVPHRGERNEPTYVKYVAEKIAELKGVSVTEVEKATFDSTKRLFGIK